jgi:hypothetical protein
MKLALQSGSKKQAKEALQDLKRMAKNAKHRVTEARRVENDKAGLQSVARTLRARKRSERKDESTATSKPSSSMSSMMARVRRVQKASAKMAHRASKSESIIRMQAEAEARRQLRKIASESKVVSKSKSRNRASRNIANKLNSKARRIAKKYIVLVKAAGVASGSQIKTVTNKVTKVLGKLDTADRNAGKRQQAYQRARSKLSNMRRDAKNAIRNNMKVIRGKVKLKMKALKVKQRERAQKQLKKQLRAAHGPRKWLLVAQIHSRKAKKKLSGAKAMLARAVSGLRHQQLRLKHVKGAAAKTHVRMKIRKMKSSVREWSTRTSRARTQFRRSMKLVNKREDLVHAARAVYKGGRKAFMSKELHRTTAALRKANNAKATKLISLARKVTSLAITPGRRAAVRRVIDKAMSAENAGATQTEALKFITRKLTSPKRPPHSLLKEDRGLSRSAYEAQREAMQEYEVTSGRYGQRAKNMLAHELQRVHAGGDPSTPRHGISRKQLRAAEKQDLRSLKKTPFVKRVVPTSRKAGLSKYRYEASVAAIHDHRVQMGIYRGDKRDKEKADRRIRRVKQSWNRYQKQVNSMEQDAKQQRDDDTSQELVNTKASHRSGMAHFEQQWKKLPILP